MKRVAPVLMLLFALAVPPAWGAEPAFQEYPATAKKATPAPVNTAPKAVIVTAAVVPAGTPILLDGSQSAGDALRWKLKRGPAGVMLQTYDQPGHPAILAVVQHAPPGAYSFVLIATGKGPDGGLDYDFDFADLTVGDSPPVPPTPPAPGDALTQAVRVAYARDTDGNKAAELAFLVAVFQGAPSLLTPDVKTYGDLLPKLSAALRTPGVGLPKGALPATMNAVGDELQAQFGKDPAAPIDPAKVGATFTHIAAALAAAR